jgi:hypothetical protein
MNGHRDYKLGFGLSQNENIDGALNLLKIELIKEDNYPKNVIELGTYKGGMSFLLKDIFTKSDVYTFDIGGNCDTERLEKESGAKCFTMDIFSPECEEIVKNLIQKSGQTVLFCDNGNKVREFNLFSGYLKSGDIILAHDYAPDGDYFNNYMVDKIWNWKEIEWNDIKDACEINSLEDFMSEEFLKAAWICKRKK